MTDPATQPPQAILIEVVASPVTGAFDAWYVDSADPDTGDAYNTVERPPRVRGTIQTNADLRTAAVIVHLARTRPLLRTSRLSFSQEVTEAARSDAGLEHAVGYVAELRRYGTGRPLSGWRPRVRPL